MKRVILDQRDRCAEWARQRIPHVPSWGEWCEAIGLEEDGELLAVVVYNLYSSADIAMHIAAVPGRRWMTREFLRVAFRYPFVQLGCRRVSGYVPASNADAQRFDEHLGFRREGLMRHALPDDDIIVYGMLREEARRFWE
jgi:RimJ/RimL family protein N-acetyltransferase